MTDIILNGQLTQLPADVFTVADLLRWKNIPTAGTAVAVNGKLVTAAKHSVAKLQPLDTVTIISAAYGG